LVGWETLGYAPITWLSAVSR